MATRTKKVQEVQEFSDSVPDKHRQKVLEYVAFNLSKALRDKGVSQSELARMVWGENPAGGARGRDQVNMFCRGRKLLGISRAKEFASALNVPLEDIYPVGLRSEALDASEKTVIKMTDVGGGMFHISLNKILSAKQAAKIIAIASAEDA